VSFDDMPHGGERTGSMNRDVEGYLVAIVYDEESKAAEMLSVLRDLQSSGDVQVSDAVGIACDADGKTRIVETVDQQSGHAVRKGALWGVVVGALLAVPVVGLAAGAGVGAFAAKTADTGVTREFQKRVAERLGPQTSAVLVIGRATNREKVLEAISPLGGHVIHTDMPNDALQELEKALDPEQA